MSFTGTRTPSISNHQTLAWDYTYQNTSEQEDDSPSIQYENHNASLNDVLYFGTQLCQFADVLGVLDGSDRQSGLRSIPA